jgi:hypothetical protein
MVAVVSQLLLHSLTPRTALTAAVSMLLVSLALIELALWGGSLAVFLGGTAAGGLAAGLAFMGGIATINLIAEPEHRAQTVAAFLSCAFAGLAIPSVAVGLASQSIGTKRPQLRRSPTRRRCPGRLCVNPDPRHARRHTRPPCAVRRHSTKTSRMGSDSPVRRPTTATNAALDALVGSGSSRPSRSRPQARDLDPA